MKCLFCDQAIEEYAARNAIGRVYRHRETGQQSCGIVDAYAQPADGDKIWHVTLSVIGLVRAADAQAAVGWLTDRIEKQTGLSIFTGDRIRVFESEPVDYNSVENPDG